MPTSYTFTYNTGLAGQGWFVPDGVTMVQIECWGAQGGGPSATTGGLGGYARAWYPVSPGEMLIVSVGGVGQNSSGGGGGAGGWNGGGAGTGPGGGGATDVRQGGNNYTDRIIVAGGGGGMGGGGGGLTGEQQGLGAQLAGTQTAGGRGLYGSQNGSLALGGHAGTFPWVMGGGGGGYYGGAGGGIDSSGTLGTSAGGGGSGYVGNGSHPTMQTGVRSGNGLVVITLLTPNAPTLIAPANNTTLLGSVNQTFTFAFSSSVAGDSMSAYDLRYRAVGAASWVDISVESPNPSIVFLPATISTPGPYEWQVRTYDSVGVVGPYSASSFFTIASPTPGPVITAPVNNATIPGVSATVSWSAPTQSRYEVRRVADDGAGNATGTVYWTTGAVIDTNTRSIPVAFPTNNRREHVQVRVFDKGLWSPYSDVTVQVLFTPPPTAALTVSTNDTTGTMTLGITVPAPTGTQPTPVSMDVYRTEGAGPLERVATALPIAPSWPYRAAASGVDYTFMVRLFGANGTSSDSAPASVVVVSTGGGGSTPTYYGGYGAGYSK